MAYDMWGNPIRKVRKSVAGGTKKFLIEHYDHRCQKCKKKFVASKLAVHHKSGNPSNNSLTNLTNLTNLCHNCHSGMHTYKTKTINEGFGLARKKKVLVAKPLRKKRPKKTKRKRKVYRDLWGRPMKTKSIFDI